MITLITFSELEKLYRERELRKSDAFDFVTPAAKSLFHRAYLEMTGQPLGELMYVSSVKGHSLDLITSEAMEDLNSDALAYLSVPDGDVVAIIIDPMDYKVSFSDLILEEVQTSYNATELEYQDFLSAFHKGVEPYDYCGYGIKGILKIEELRTVLYPPELEARLRFLQNRANERQVTFTAASLFEKTGG